MASKTVAIMEAHWRVNIRRGIMSDKHFYWTATPDEDIGLGGNWHQSSAWEHHTSTPALCIANWEEFAVRNFITSYELERNQYTEDITGKTIQWRV